VSQGYFLDCHHPEMAMNMKLLDLTSDENVRVPTDMSRPSEVEEDEEGEAEA